MPQVPQTLTREGTYSEPIPSGGVVRIDPNLRTANGQRLGLDEVDVCGAFLCIHVHDDPNLPEFGTFEAQNISDAEAFLSWSVSSHILLFKKANATPQTGLGPNGVNPSAFPPIALAGGGEVNTASNLGGGAGIFASKVAEDLQFKSLVAGQNITLTPNADEIEIAAAEDTASNLGGGEGVFASKVADDFQFKSLVAGANVTLTPNANEIEVSAQGYTGPQGQQADGAFLLWDMQTENIPDTGAVTIKDTSGNGNDSTITSANNTIIDDHVLGERMVRWGSANVTTPALGADVNASGFTVSGSFHRNTFVGTTDVRMFGLFEGATRSAGVFFTGGTIQLCDAAGAYAPITAVRSSRMGTVRITFRRTNVGGGQVIDEVFANATKIWTSSPFVPQAVTAACVIRFGDGAANPPCRDFQVWLSPRTDLEIEQQVARYQPWM